MNNDLKEAIEDYEILISLPSKCDDLEVQELMILESIYEQCLTLNIEPHHYTNSLDEEVKERVVKKLKLCTI
jgi:hypothetical protein